MKYKMLIVFLSTITLFSCKQNEIQIIKKEIVKKQPKAVSYTLENAKNWLKENTNDSLKIEIVTAVNRTDKANLSKLDSIVIPSNFDGNVQFYLPFPLEVDYLKDVSKILIFSYPTQTFGAYENGILTYSGPTNMGRKKDKNTFRIIFYQLESRKNNKYF